MEDFFVENLRTKNLLDRSINTIISDLISLLQLFGQSCWALGAEQFAMAQSASILAAVKLHPAID